MIIYDLRCTREHAFEGWFHDAVDYEVQAAIGHLRCPVCDDQEVRRVPSAVAIGRSLSSPSPPPQVAESAAPQPSHAALPSGSQAVAVVRQLVDTLLSMSENVGSEFSNEARRIHYAESPERAIHGEASDDDIAALADEGIDVLRLPMIKKQNLT